MFDFSSPEIIVIVIIALICIGPKDLPLAIRAITRVLKTMSLTAREFQSHVDEMMRETELKDMQSAIHGIRGTSLQSTINEFLDPDGRMDT